MMMKNIPMGGSDDTDDKIMIGTSHIHIKIYFVLTSSDPINCDDYDSMNDDQWSYDHWSYDAMMIIKNDWKYPCK